MKVAKFLVLLGIAVLVSVLAVSGIVYARAAGTSDTPQSKDVIEKTFPEKPEGPLNPLEGGRLETDIFRDITMASNETAVTAELNAHNAKGTLVAFVGRARKNGVLEDNLVTMFEKAGLSMLEDTPARFTDKPAERVIPVTEDQVAEQKEFLIGKMEEGYTICIATSSAEIANMERLAGILGKTAKDDQIIFSLVAKETDLWSAIAALAEKEALKDRTLDNLKPAQVKTLGSRI